MEELINRITSGRIFKQIANYAYGRRATDYGARVDTRSSSAFQYTENCLSPQADTPDGPRLTKSALSPVGSADVEMLQLIDESPVENIATGSMNPDHGTPHFHTVEYSSGTGVLPLTARYTEVFTFVGKGNGVQTGVSLTEAMVWQLNIVLQGEQRTAEYRIRINALESKRARVQTDVSDINSQLEDLPEGLQDSPALLESVLKDQEELNSLTHLSEELTLEIQGLERLI